jgi:hypothetical protein
MRYWGFLANRDRSTNIKRVRTLIRSRTLAPRTPAPDPRPAFSMPAGHDALAREDRPAAAENMARLVMNTARVIRPALAQLALSCDSFTRFVGHTAKAPVSVAHAGQPDRVSPYPATLASTAHYSRPPCSLSQPLALRYFPHLGLAASSNFTLSRILTSAVHTLVVRRCLSSLSAIIVSADAVIEPYELVSMVRLIGHVHLDEVFLRQFRVVYAERVADCFEALKQCLVPRRDLVHVLHRL